VGCQHLPLPLLPIFQVRLPDTKHIKLITKARAMIALVVALFSFIYLFQNSLLFLFFHFRF
jgi:hypothetical protein